MFLQPDIGPLVIVGAGGFGRECLDIVEALQVQGNALDFIGFIDDSGGDTALLARRGARCLGPLGALPSHATYVIAIGDGATRLRMDDELTRRGLVPTVLLHPNASLGSDCRIGPGTILNAGATVTTNITLGRHVQIHANATVGHDATLLDGVSVYPGATISGAVTAGEGATIGTGANVLPGVTIGSHAFIGAGAVVHRDVAAGVTVVGVPARPIG